MKLVVGLGNKGNNYINTRHNIGFKVIDEYLGDVQWKEKKHYKYFINEDNNVIFIKPLTYMNLSGKAVQEVVNFYKITMDEILIIQDDLDIPLGILKIKRNSSSGGHNGIKSIIQNLGNDSFARLKIGIGKNETIPTDKYVLSKFSQEENDIIENNIFKYKKIIDMFINNGIDYVLNNYNKN